jgi:hypothetical protein
MRAYVITTGTIFGLLTLAHLARMFAEDGFAVDAWYWVITAITAALCAWAVYVLRSART